jgi:hypothetical protein
MANNPRELNNILNDFLREDDGEDRRLTDDQIR